MELLAGLQPSIWLIIIGVIVLFFIVMISVLNSNSNNKIAGYRDEIAFLENTRNRQASALNDKFKKEIAHNQERHKEILGKMKLLHDDKILDLRKETAARLETIIMEAAEFAHDFKHENDQQKRVLAKAVVDRAEKFPMMLGCLRGMVDTMQKLKDLTHRNDVDPESGQEPEAFDSFDEMNIIFDKITLLHRYFDELRTEMRPYLINNDYKLPKIISSFINDFRRGKLGTLPGITDDDIYFYYLLLGVDTMTLTNDLYGFGRNDKITENIDWSALTREFEFRKGVLERRGFRIDP